MPTLTLEQRRDPAVARRIIQALFASTGISAAKAFEEFLRESLRYLAERHPDRWGITLFADEIRLNVGWVECLVLGPETVRVLLDANSTSGVTRFESREYPKAPGCVMAPLDKELLTRVLPGLQRAHQLALSSAARYSPPRSIREAHSPGLTRLLRSGDPSYATGEGGGVRRYWTAYWRAANWWSNPEYVLLSAAGSDQFRRRNVSNGDVVYVVSQSTGQLLVGGRMYVDKVVSRHDAERILGRRELYDVDEWVIAKKGSGTPMRHNRVLTKDVTSRLRFIVNGEQRSEGLLFVNDHELDRQTTRGVRELTVESAMLLDEIIDRTDAGLGGDRPIVVSEEVLRLLRSQPLPIAEMHEEDPSVCGYPEGTLRQVLVNRYERDSAARADCIRHHGAVCSACGFSFAEMYGDVAAGFIHVHHLEPLSTTGPGYVVEPVRDLRPLCPNCHAVAHRRTPPHSLEELRALLACARAKYQ